MNLNAIINELKAIKAPDNGPTNQTPIAVEVASPAG